MILLNATDISKSYTVKPLLTKLSYAINEGDKIGLIGVNGTGKSTLLRITAGAEEADSGKIVLTGGVRIGYLPQAPDYDPEATVLEQALSHLWPEVLAEGDYLCKSMLYQLGINDFDAKMGTLSGGERKRVAMAGILTNPCEILILDEPTNHIDSETVVWLEKFLQKFKGAIFMVTHDRYFLDRVTNVILELTSGKLYRHEGNYQYYLEAKAAREEMELAAERKRRTLYRRELEWMRRGAQARTTKAKARIDRFHELEQGKLVIDESAMEMSSVASRLGKKVIELKNVTKSYDGKVLIDNFTYTVLRNDRLGILGENGSGKSTMLKLLCGELEPDKLSDIADAGREGSVEACHEGSTSTCLEDLDSACHEGSVGFYHENSTSACHEDSVGACHENSASACRNLSNFVEGSVEIGDTVKIGYFSQENEHMDKSRRVIEYVCDIAHNVQTTDGYISASQMLERFLFPPHMHSIPVGRLSGGEQRRLYLLGILMSAPNVLLLDEPTNDLDIETLCILENYLDTFAGAVIAVSHDRHFIDRTCKHVFVYEGDGKIGHYMGGYTDWAETKAALEEERLEAERAARLAGGGVSSVRGSGVSGVRGGNANSVPSGNAGRNGGGGAGGGDNANAMPNGSAGRNGGGAGGVGDNANSMPNGSAGSSGGNANSMPNNTGGLGRTADGRRQIKLKFTFKEQKEFETIDEDIANLEAEIEAVDAEINTAGSDFGKLQKLTAERDELNAKLEEKMERWVYLNDLAEQIAAQKK